MDNGTAIPANTDKPVVVRVKRKASHSPLDAFWLEINERPIKRPLLDFEKLSISGSSSNRVEELKTKKVLVRHVESVISSEVSIDVLRSFVPNSSDALELKGKNEGRRCTYKTENQRNSSTMLDAIKKNPYDFGEILRNSFEELTASRVGGGEIGRI